MKATHWLYPTNSSSGYWLDTANGVHRDVTPENLWSDIEAYPSRPDSWHLSTGYRSMRINDHIWIYVAGRQYICAMARVSSIEQHPDGTWHAILLWNLPATEVLKRNPLPRSRFGQIPQAPCRANDSTSAMLNQWLASHGLHASSAEQAPVSMEDARLKVLATIVRRQGQLLFRQTLLANYGYRCCATDERTAAVLEAAHIVPYRGQHTNEASNGLLLRADVHTLFDLHLVSVDSKGRWVIAPELSKSSYATLQGRRLRQPRSSPPNKSALASHYREFKAKAGRKTP